MGRIRRIKEPTEAITAYVYKGDRDIVLKSLGRKSESEFIREYYHFLANQIREKSCILVKETRKLND